MSGLPAIIDFGFVYGRRLDELALGVHHARLSFDNDVGVDLVCDFSLDGERFTVRDAHALHVLLGLVVRGVSKIGAGDLEFDFGAHHIEIHDSNDGDDSYSIRTRELFVVV
jgi:hypothetical protein